MPGDLILRKDYAEKSFPVTAGFAMILLMTAILVSGLRTTFRWQNAFWIIASVGTFLAFIVLALGSTPDFQAHFAELNAKVSGSTATIGGRVQKLSDAWDYADAVQKWPGIDTVVVGAVKVTSRVSFAPSG